MAKRIVAKQPDDDLSVKKLNEMHVERHKISDNENSAKVRNRRVVGTVNNRLS